MKVTTEQGRKYVEEQKEFGKALQEAEQFKKIENERIMEYIDQELSFRTRHNRMSIEHKFNHKLDLAVQEDAERYSMNNIFNKLQNGEPVPPHAVKESGEYREDIPEIDDLTDALVKAQQNREQFGEDYGEQIQKIVEASQKNDDDKTTTIKEEAPTKEEESKDS
mgnify:FL=1